MPTFLTATDRPIRRIAAGCDQQGRLETRTHRVVQWADTVATGPGSADALGDDQAERHSNWGALQECGTHRESSKTVSDDAPSAGWVVLIGVLCVAVVGACALIAQHLPRAPT